MRYWNLFFRILLILSGLVFFFILLRSLAKDSLPSIFEISLTLAYAVSECIPLCCSIAALLLPLHLHREHELHIVTQLYPVPHKLYTLFWQVSIPLCLYLFLYTGVIKPEIKQFIGSSYQHLLASQSAQSSTHLRGGNFWQPGPSTGAAYLQKNNNETLLVQAPTFSLNAETLTLSSGSLIATKEGQYSTLSFSRATLPLSSSKHAKIRPIFLLGNSPEALAEIQRRVLITLSPFFLLCFGTLCGHYILHFRQKGLGIFFIGIFLLYIPLFLRAKKIEMSSSLSEIGTLWSPALVLIILSLLLHVITPRTLAR